MPRIVVVDKAFGDAALEREAARPLGVDVQYRPCDSAELVPEAAAGAEGVLVRYTPVDRTLIDRLPGVRVIGRYGVGVDNIDVEAAASRGVAVVNVPDYGTEEVAQHAAAMILASWRRLRQASDLVSDGRWDSWDELAPVRPLSQCTLGLIGAGRIGRELLRQIGHLFGRTLAHDPRAGSPLPEGTGRAGLEELIAGSDVLSLHCPLTPDTRHLLGRERLALMPQGSLLVNVSRGALVDNAALLGALEEGRPSAAALDVFETEPLGTDSPLVDHPQVIHTPHVGWYSTAATRNLRTLLARRCAGYLTGGDAETLVGGEP